MKRTLIPTTLIALAIVGGGSASALDIAPEPAPPEERPQTHPAEVVGQPGTVMQFMMALVDQGGDTMDDISTYSTMTTDAIDLFDLDGASMYAQMTADGYGELEALIPTLPGSATPVAQAQYTAMATCHLAWQYSADVLDSFDIGAIDGATVLLDSCSAALETATEMIPG